MNNGNLWMAVEGERGWEVIKVRPMMPLEYARYGRTVKGLRKLIRQTTVLVKTPDRLRSKHGNTMWVKGKVLFLTKDAAEHAAVMFAIGARDI